MYDGSTKFQTSATGATLTGNLVMGAGQVKFADSGHVMLGDSNDLRLYHDGSNSHIQQVGTGALIISHNVENADIKLQASGLAGSAGTAVDFIILDSSQGSIRMKRKTKLDDNLKATFGDGEDLSLWHSGSHSYINNDVGDLFIYNNTDDGDIKFYSDDGSGGVSEYFRLDGGLGYLFVSKTLNFDDNVPATFGPSGDLNIRHDGSNSLITNNTGNLNITNGADDGDIIFESDNGSGGIDTYMTINGGDHRTHFYKQTRHYDNIAAKFGHSDDLSIYHDGTHSYIENNTGVLYIKNNADDQRIRFVGDDGAGGTATYFDLEGSQATHDGSATTMLMTKWNDNSRIALGDAFDMQIWHDGTNSIIYNQGGDLFIRQATTDKDLIFQCDDGSGGLETYFFLDGSLSGGDPITVFPDDSYLAFGPDVDMSLHHDGVDSKIRNQTGNLVIEQNANDKDILFKCDDGSGGTVEYFYLDGSAGNILFGKELRLLDGVQIQLGSDNDMQVTHNGAIGTIQNTTGDLQLKAIGSASDITFYAANTLLLSLDGGREVVHHHRGVEYNTVLSNNSDYTVGTANHIIMMHNMSAGRTVTIATSECNLGRVLIIKDRDGQAGMHNITIATEGSHTIDGAATKVINSGYGSVTLVCDGTNWSTI